MKTPQTKEQLLLIAEKTRTKFIKINPTINEDIPIKSSKIGGIPYWKHSIPYPKISGKVAKLMAQINFEDLKGLSLEDFPEKGILQFYFPEGDDMWGLTFDESPSNIKVIYHEDTTEPSYTSKEIKKASLNDDDGMPYEQPCSLSFSESSELLSLSDEYQSSQQYNFDSLSDELNDYMYDELSNAGSKLGGYAYFTQSDPRAYGEPNKVKDWVLLLQIDTDDEAGIMWGDCGVANWFISREDLKKRDFSKVLFNWDCC